MHIWLTIPNLSKKSGGPSTVVQFLSEQLAALGASVTVVTGHAKPGQSETLPRDQRVTVFRAPVGLGRWRSAFRDQLRERLAQKPSSQNSLIVHDFGLWQPANHAVAVACKQLEIPLACSSCGMLAPWALRHKAWKKTLAWWLYQCRDLSNARLLVATAEREVQDIRRRVPGKPIALVPNGVDLPERRGRRPPPEDRRPQTGGRTVVFLGRIHPVKGLSNLIQAWHTVRPAGWRCILAGPDEAGHRKHLEAVLRSQDLEATFEFPGMLEDDQKWALLSKADLFVLPSFTENFGVAAAEALACELPVIATTGTPWKELREEHCGWWIDIGVEPLATALKQATSLSDRERAEMGIRGRRLVEERYSWQRVATLMLSAYAWVLERGPQPPCVTD